MKILAVAVALFAVLAFAVGWKAGDVTMELLGPFALIAAYCCWRSGPISRFLKIFIALFSTETILFGLAALAALAGYWPKALQDAFLPTTVVLTVAIFAILVFAVSHIPVVRAMTRIADRFFNASDITVADFGPLRLNMLKRVLATGMVVFLVLINQAQVAISVRLRFLQPRFLQRHSGKERARILADADLGLHALGLYLCRERGDRICHQLLSGHSLAALADALLHQSLAGRTYPLPHVADRRRGRQSRPAYF